MHFSVRLRTSRNVSRPPEPTDRRASRSHSYESLAQLLPAGPRQSDCERVTPQPATSTADTCNAWRERFTSLRPTRVHHVGEADWYDVAASQFLVLPPEFGLTLLTLWPRAERRLDN